MELIMLGTGNAMVTRCYNTCFVLRSGEQHLLVDGGGGNTPPDDTTPPGEPTGKEEV